MWCSWFRWFIINNLKRFWKLFSSYPQHSSLLFSEDADFIQPTSHSAQVWINWKLQIMNRKKVVNWFDGNIILFYLNKKKVIKIYLKFCLEKNNKVLTNIEKCKCWSKCWYFCDSRQAAVWWTVTGGKISIFMSEKIEKWHIGIGIIFVSFLVFNSGEVLQFLAYLIKAMLLGVRRIVFINVLSRYHLST